jgi:hypothetical protein
MNMQAEFVLGVWLLVLVFWLVPFVLVGKSTQTKGGEKVGWLLAMIFISWFAWILYLLFAPLKSSAKQAKE